MAAQAAMAVQQACPATVVTGPQGLQVPPEAQEDQVDKAATLAQLAPAEPVALQVVPVARTVTPDLRETHSPSPSEWVAAAAMAAPVRPTPAATVAAVVTVGLEATVAPAATAEEVQTEQPALMA